MMPENSQGLLFAGFIDRTAAFIIDAIIVATLYLYLLEGVVGTGRIIGPLFFAGTAVTFDQPGMPVIFGSVVTGTVTLVLLCWLYSAGVTSSRFRGTFGKMIMGMKVITVTGEPVSFGRATVRFIAKILAGLILFIGFFMIHFSPTRQGLHDRFAGTYVVYTKSVAAIPMDAGPAGASEPDETAAKRAEESRANVRKGLLLIILPLGIVAALLVISVVLAAMVFSMSPSGELVQKNRIIAATVQQTDAHTIIVTYHGGPDAAELVSLDISINDSAPESWSLPQPGDEKVFHEGTVERDRILVTGVFRDGTQKVVVDTWL